MGQKVSLCSSNLRTSKLDSEANTGYNSADEMQVTPKKSISKWINLKIYRIELMFLRFRWKNEDKAGISIFLNEAHTNWKEDPRQDDDTKKKFQRGQLVNKSRFSLYVSKTHRFEDFADHY